MPQTAQPWKTDQWFVSPWNFVDEVTAGFNPPAKLRIHDVTLRDGEQQAGIVFTRDEKVRIAEKLAEAGIHRIEAGTPAVSPNDEAAIKEIVKRKLGPEIFVLSRCMIDDVKRATAGGAPRRGAVEQVVVRRVQPEVVCRLDPLLALELGHRQRRPRMDVDVVSDQKEPSGGDPTRDIAHLRQPVARLRRAHDRAVVRQVVPAGCVDRVRHSHPPG